MQACSTKTTLLHTSHYPLMRSWGPACSAVPKKWRQNNVNDEKKQQQHKHNKKNKRKDKWKVECSPLPITCWETPPQASWVRGNTRIRRWGKPAKLPRGTTSKHNNTTTTQSQQQQQHQTSFMTGCMHNKYVCMFVCYVCMLPANNYERGVK